ncbi:unnamed protein product [Cylindrotheca closterium]|uniref:Alpha-ketoglutarate-dependent dioxygenase AlkB-like domain-containing protein n=1 Tax=Cylindrotheca closterium TaxID=2856 RepID=A0AAD2CA22_9STRA|nr:unnamed protein product [Cylindrotheca closterium]
MSLRLVNLVKLADRGLIRCRRRFSVAPTVLEADASFVDTRFAPSDFTPDVSVVYPNVLTEDEANLILDDVKGRLRRRRYEKGHWDAVITNYKEVELSDLNFENPEIPNIFRRIRQQLATNHLLKDGKDENRTIEWLPCHAIDLKKEGELNAHVDSVKFSGDLVAGVSLMSSSIMRLIPHMDGEGGNVNEESTVEGENKGWVDLYLPPLSLYALTGVGRYRYAHELLPTNSTFTQPDGTEILAERDHRISIIFRDAKEQA